MSGYRKQARRSNGRFTQNTLTNCFGISKSNINEKAETFTCKQCEYSTVDRFEDYDEKKG